MSSWKEYKIGQIVSLEYGKGLRDYRNGDGLYDVFGTNGQIGKTNSFLFDHPSVIIGRKGAYRGVHLAKRPSYVIDTAFYTKNKIDELDTIFLYYWFKNVDINDMDSGSAIPSTSRDEVYELEIELPPLSEQKAIASILGSLDDKIDLLHRQNATLEAMAETLFRQWFVEPNKRAEIKGIKASQFVDGTFAMWIAETVGGEWGKEAPEGDFVLQVNCIRGTDIADLNTGLPNRTPVRYVKERKFKAIEPREGDLIIEISGGTEDQSTGRTTYINADIKSLFQYPVIFSNFCRLLRIKRVEYTFFVYCYLQYLYNQDEFFNLENGSSGIKNLDYKTLLFDSVFAMPNADLVVLFNSKVEPLFKKINQNKKQVRTLTALRDTLLPKLMSGEVRVKECSPLAF